MSEDNWSSVNSSPVVCNWSARQLPLLTRCQHGKLLEPNQTNQRSDLLIPRSLRESIAISGKPNLTLLNQSPSKPLSKSSNSVCQDQFHKNARANSQCHAHAGAFSCTCQRSQNQKLVLWFLSDQALFYLRLPLVKAKDRSLSTNKWTFFPRSSHLVLRSPHRWRG